MCTGMIALVRGVMAASTEAGSSLERVGVDVGKDGNSAQEKRRGRRGDKGVRRHDHLIAKLYVQHPQAEFQRACAVDKRNAVFRALKGGEFLFKFNHLRAGIASPLAGPQGCQQRLLIHTVPDRPGGKRRRPQRRAAVTGQLLIHALFSLTKIGMSLAMS